MKRAVLYARVSSDDRSKDGRNLTGQLEMGRKYAQEHGYIITAELAEDDRGASGVEIDLPQLSQVRDMAAAGEFDVLVVRELDRLSRNLAKQLIVEQELKRAGVAIEYVLGEYPDTPEGNLMKHIRAGIAEFEREKIAERSIRGRRLKVKAGHVIVHGQSPYGYRVAEVDGKTMLTVHKPEARVVRMIFEWYIVGNGESGPLSLGAIIRRLTEMGIPTFRDKRDSNRPRYGKWSKSSVNTMLANETYAGTWHYGKWRYKGEGSGGDPDNHLIAVEVPAIVSREVWKMAQARRKRNQRDARRNMRHEYLLSKRVTCGHCGYKMAGSAKQCQNKLYLYYQCHASKRDQSVRSCDMPYFRADHVDAVVWNWIKSVLADPVALAEGLRAGQAEREQTSKSLRDKLAVLDDLLSDNRQRLERLLDLYLRGDFPKEILTDRKARLEETVSALERERIDLAAQLEGQILTDDQIEAIRDFVAQVIDGLEVADADFKVRRRVVEMLDVQATLAVEDGQKVIYARCVLGEEALSIASISS